jgi:hypothetical protein
MTNFAKFYADGGLFMNVITFTAVAAVTALLLHSRARRLGADDSKYLSLAERLALLCVGFGLLGSAIGVTELCTALMTVAPERYDAKFAHGMAIVPATTTWALMWAIPTWIVSTVLRHRSPVVFERRPVSS